MVSIAEVGKDGVRVTTIEQSSSNRQAFHVLRLVLIGALIAIGIDRFVHFMGGEAPEFLIAQSIGRRIPQPAYRLLLIEGGIEIALAAAIGIAPRWGGYLATFWLSLFTINLFLARQYELGVHGVTLVAMAFAVAKMATAYSRVTDLD
jgi:hypothetical protein